MGKVKVNTSKEITFTGYIEEYEKDDGNSGVMISDGDHEFVVVMDRQGKKLVDYMDEEVEVIGVVNKTQGIQEIKVINFRPLDEYEYEDDVYYEDDDEYEDDDLFGDRR